MVPTFAENLGQSVSCNIRSSEVIGMVQNVVNSLGIKSAKGLVLWDL